MNNEERLAVMPLLAKKCPKKPTAPVWVHKTDSGYEMNYHGLRSMVTPEGHLLDDSEDVTDNIIRHMVTH